MEYKDYIMLDILGKRYLFFIFSLVLIIPGMVVLAIWGIPFSIDFTGGSYLELQFSNSVPQSEEIVNLYYEFGITDVQVQTSENAILIIRSQFIEDDVRGQIMAVISERFDENVEMIRFDSVGGTIGQEVTSQAALAVGVSALGVILFITFAFRGVEHALRYGICAIVAMLHDFLVVLSISALGGKFFGWQFDTLFLTAFLTVIGFSVQDKIVVFDRIRENSSIFRKISFEKLTNHSIVQTLSRSINTQLMTSEFLLLALALFGGVTLRVFSIVLLIGLFMGTYSSIFVAAPILVIWENKEWRNWFKSKKTKAV
ncbi:MAG: protein translocase subunit SecF [Anaerolineaceae bacterium]|nr:protein translocase subunit SecF [Anaerolineaceae bacterium]